MGSTEVSVTGHRYAPPQTFLSPVATLKTAVWWCGLQGFQVQEKLGPLPQLEAGRSTYGRLDE